MIVLFRRWAMLLLVVALPSLAGAHVGSPTVFFEGAAGAYPLHVTIRPPGVIPGLAEISVRVDTNAVERVTVVPIRWNTGKEGAPRADVAEPVRGEPGLFNAQLWFMVGGAQSVEVEVTGAAGHGRVVVPVNAVATAVLPMPRALGALLALLGTGLVVLAAGIVGGAVRESGLPSGVAPPRKRVWAARAMTSLTLAGIVAFLWFGKKWWDKEAQDYRSNRLFRPVDTEASVRVDGGRRVLRLNYAVDLMRRNGPLVPDHGKLMHLFMVREPGLDGFAHLHPTRIDRQTFDASLPALPAGEYRVYGDITYETGLSDTLVARVTLPPATAAETKLDDADDSWREAGPIGGSAAGDRIVPAAATAYAFARVGSEPLEANRETHLRFTIEDAAGKRPPIEPYMGMAGHLIVTRDDGAVFTHLHPSGSFSMAAQQLFEMRLAGAAPLAVASYRDEPICKVPPVTSTMTAGAAQELSFPYAFPRPGRYRCWVQAKVAGEVLTGVFDVDVLPANRDA